MSSSNSEGVVARYPSYKLATPGVMFLAVIGAVLIYGVAMSFKEPTSGSLGMKVLVSLGVVGLGLLLVLYPFDRKKQQYIRECERVFKRKHGSLNLDFEIIKQIWRKSEKSDSKLPAFVDLSEVAESVVAGYQYYVRGVGEEAPSFLAHDAWEEYRRIIIDQAAKERPFGDFH